MQHYLGTPYQQCSAPSILVLNMTFPVNSQNSNDSDDRQSSSGGLDSGTENRPRSPTSATENYDVQDQDLSDLMQADQINQFNALCSVAENKIDECKKALEHVMATMKEEQDCISEVLHKSLEVIKGINERNSNGNRINMGCGLEQPDTYVVDVQDFQKLKALFGGHHEVNRRANEAHAQYVEAYDAFCAADSAVRVFIERMAAIYS